MSKSVAVFAEIRGRRGTREAILAAIDTCFAATLEEPGTEVYGVHVSDDEPDVVRIYEVYDDVDARTAHSTSEAVAVLRAALADLVAEPPRIVVTRPLMAKGHGDWR